MNLNKGVVSASFLIISVLVISSSLIVIGQFKNTENKKELTLEKELLIDEKDFDSASSNILNKNEDTQIFSSSGNSKGSSKRDSSSKSDSSTILESKDNEICKRIFGNNEPSKSMNIFFIGAGYEENQIFCSEECDLNNYEKILENDINRFLYSEDYSEGYGILTIEPFKTNHDKINVYMLTIPIDYNYNNNRYDWYRLGKDLVIENCEEFIPNNPIHVIIGYDGAIGHGGGSSPVSASSRLSNNGFKNTVSLFIHEIGHNFGLYDIYSTPYKTTGIMTDSYSIPNCDNVPGCPKWCSGETIPTPSITCTYYLTEEECNKHSSSEKCLWLAEPDSYFNSQCIKNTNIPGNPNLGKDCLEGTGCYWGCFGAGYRAVPQNNFANINSQIIDEDGKKHTYEPVSERFIKNIFDCCYSTSYEDYDYEYCLDFSQRYKEYNMCNNYIESNQKLNLKNQPSETRFEITDRIWPSNHGEADVCLWEDDKLSAVSIGIDDNIVWQHDWWVEQGNIYDWKFTWYVIVDYLEKGYNPTSFGTWDDFRYLYSLGHDIESHTMTHGHCADDCESENVYDCCDLDYEYGESQKIIGERIPGNPCLTISYSGGHRYEHIPDIAAKYYVAGRWTTGAPNPVNKIWYVYTNSISWINPDTSWIDKILDPKNSRYYRGWLSIHYHKVMDFEESIQAFDYLKNKEDDIWIGLFKDIALYGQERDTHVLSVTSITDSEIRFNLTDEMNDTYFIYPLTIKIRLNNDWDSMIATQNGKKIDFKIIEYNVDKYALIKAIPDKGEVILSKTIIGDFNNDGCVNEIDFNEFKLHYLEEVDNTNWKYDLNNNGKIDIEDFAILGDNYNPDDC